MTCEYNGEIAPISDASLEIAEAMADERERVVEEHVRHNLSGYIAFVVSDGDNSDPHEGSIAIDYLLAGMGDRSRLRALVRYLVGEVLECTGYVDDLMSDR